MPHLYLAPWEWKQDPAGESYWTAQREQDRVGCLDLRSLPQCGSPWPTPQGYRNLFVYRQPVVLSGGRYLGDDPARLLTLQERQAFSNFFSLGETLVATNLRDAVVELMCAHGDPTGQTRWKPLRGSPRIGYRLILGPWDYRWRWDRMDIAFRRAGMEVDHQDWLRLKAADQLAGRTHYRKVLTALAEKYYGRSAAIQAVADRLLQAWGETESVVAEPHDTVIGDTLVEASDTSLGAHTATGPNGGFSWTAVDGVFTVLGASDDVRGPTSAAGGFPASARAESPLASDEHYAKTVSVWFETTSSIAGVALRFAAAAETFIAVWARDSTTTGHAIGKVVTGTLTTLKSDSIAAGPAGWSIKGDVDANDLITLYINDVAYFTQMDTTGTGNLLTGILAHSDISREVRQDNFEAGDLGGAARRMFVVS